MKRSFLPAIAGFIPRPRVDSLFENGLRYSLVLVIAGPGYGKTLSAAHYLKTADVRLIWMHISNRRRRAADFWEDLVRTAGRELPDYAQELEALGFPDSAGQFEQFRRITAAAAEGGKRLVWVVDNYERIVDESVIGLLNDLLDCELLNFTLVVLCNIMLPFAAVLPAAGQYRITDENLAFTTDEAKMMFEHYGAPTAPDVIASACEVTGGWPLGLRLICESNPEHPERLSNRTSVQVAADLFEQHYFRSYPPDVQMQLALLALVPQFSMDMMQEGMQTPQQAVYEMLMRHPFVSCDYASGLFAFQPMYHDFLQQKQALVSGAQRAGMYARAGAWFMGRGMLFDAMDCFWEAADYDGFMQAVARLPRTRKPVSITNGILKRLVQIPRAYADRNPSVDFSIAFMLLSAAKAEQARTLLLEVEARLAAEPETEETRLLLGDIYATLADIGTFLSEDTGLAWMKKACALAPNGSRTHSAELMSLGNNSAFFLPSERPGELERMVEYFMAYAPYADKVKNGCGHGYEYLFAGEAAYCREDMDKAASMFNSAMLKAQRTGQHDIICNALWGLARMELYYANYKNAMALVKEIEDYINDNSLAGLYELRDCAAAYLYMRLDDLDKVPRWFGRRAQGPEEMPLALGRNLLLSAAYLLLRGDTAMAYATMLQLDSRLQGNVRWYERFCLYILMARYHMAAGEPAAFEAAFGKAYRMVRENDLKILLADYGKDMMAVIDYLKKQDTARYDMEWLDAVYRDALSYAKRLQMMRKAYGGELYGHAQSGLALTARENETLRYLAQGLTQQEMGKLMGISGNAVKKHVSKIYNKLGAVNRADAIHIASINGLVDVLN